MIGGWCLKFKPLLPVPITVRRGEPNKIRGLGDLPDPLFVFYWELVPALSQPLPLALPNLPVDVFLACSEW